MRTVVIILGAVAFAIFVPGGAIMVTILTVKKFIKKSTAKAVK